MEADQPSPVGWPSAPAPGLAARPLERPRVRVVHVLLFAATALTTTVSGALASDVDPFSSPRALMRGLPYAATLLGILFLHESGHYLMCLRYRISASLPYFLPGPPLPIGTFGAFIRIRSRFPDRRALFDVGAAGPWAGFVVALAAYGIGLAWSTEVSAPSLSHGWLLGDSLLTAWLAHVIVRGDSTNLVLHPVAYAGWLGLFVTSLNLLPAGQLDGGHVLYATVGRGTPRIAALLIAFLVWLGVRGWPGWLVWAVAITVLVSLGHPPTEDDRRPLDLRRQLAALATFVIFVITFVAEPFKLLP